MQYIAYIHSSACVSQHTAHHTETESPDPLPPMPGASMLSMAWYMSSIDMPCIVIHMTMMVVSTLMTTAAMASPRPRVWKRRVRQMARQPISAGSTGNEDTRAKMNENKA